jgi:hypothetical protein
MTSFVKPVTLVAKALGGVVESYHFPSHILYLLLKFAVLLFLKLNYLFLSHPIVYFYLSLLVPILLLS